MNTDKHGYGIGVVEFWSDVTPAGQCSNTPIFQYSIFLP
jgi:hypothetical protein